MGLAFELTGFASKDKIAIAIVCTLFGCLTMFGIVCLWEIRNDGLVRIIRLDQTRQPPILSLSSGMRFHLFLSHVWSSGQDQAHVIKRMLQVKMLLRVEAVLDAAVHTYAYVPIHPCMHTCR